MYSSNPLSALTNRSLPSAPPPLSRRNRRLALVAIALLAALSWLLVTGDASADRGVIDANEQDLASGHTAPRGVWGNDTTVWVVEDGSSGDNQLLAYNRADWSRTPAWTSPPWTAPATRTSRASGPTARPCMSLTAPTSRSSPTR